MDVVESNFKAVVLLVGGGLLWASSNPDAVPGLPSLPSWAPLALAVLGFAVIGGYFVGQHVYDLLPDPVGVFLIAMEGSDGEQGGEIWELTPQQFEEMEVRAGPLYAWQGSAVEVYECLTYDRERNVATCNWREAPPTSEILGIHEPSEAMDYMNELQNSYEERARYGDQIKRRFVSILREMDRRRAVQQDKALRQHATPEFGGDDVEDVITEHIPDEHIPDHLLGDDDQDPTADVAAGPGEGMDLLFGQDDEDALEPVAKENGHAE
jgi:hypothetical protein